VAEAAVVGKVHDLKGQAIAAFVTLREGHHPSSELRDELREIEARRSALNGEVIAGIERSRQFNEDFKRGFDKNKKP